MKKLHFIVCCFVLFYSELIIAQSNNLDFELTPPGVYTTSNAVSGWTISSQTVTSCNTTTPWVPGSPEFSVLSTPLLNLPYIGNLPNSPLGGTNIVRLGNSIANASNTKISFTLPVTFSNSVFCFAYAGIFENGAHNCCEQASFKLEIRNASGVLLSCLNQSLVIPNCNSPSTFSVNSNTYWTNWQSRYVDLFPYIGTTLNVSIICSDCSLGDHYGSLYFDLISPSVNPSGCLPVNYKSINFFQNHFCESPNAFIEAAYGFSTYSWTAPPGYPISPSQSTLGILTLTNALVGNIYTLNVTSLSGCSSIAIDTLRLTQVSILGVGAFGSCSMGASGTATVVPAGSGSGYTYQWTNSTASVVGTSSIASNLAPGNYSIVVSGIGSNTSNCGTAIQTVTINPLPNGVKNYLKPFCTGQTLTLTIPGGTNYQWYNNVTAISAAAGGTASSYTVNNPVHGSIYTLVYQSSQGCNDSIRYTLAATPPGSVTVTQNSLICPGATNGSATISLIPAAGSPPGNNSFHVFSIGNTPVYSASLSSVSSVVFTVSNLVAGQTYSVKASEGSCNYTTTFSVNTLNFDYSVGPNTQTICSGSSLAAGVSINNSPSPSGYTYSWSPTTFFGNNPGIFHFTSITPTIALGNSSTLIYSVTVTPNSINCPLTKTLAVTVTSLVTPSISSVPAFCYNSADYTVQVNPPGGTFSNTGSLFLNQSTGIITPSLAAIGINTISYVISSGSCSVSASASFAVQNIPLTISSPTQIYCGQTVTLSASGANNYLWSNGGTSPFFTANPTVNTVYAVTGSSNNCSKSLSAQVLVTSSLVVSIIGSKTLCLGNTASLFAAGANTYTWNSGAVSSNILISPSIPTIYSVTGSDLLGCKSSTQINIFVYPKPPLSLAGNFSICPGIETSLYAYGTNSYVWNTGATTHTILVSPQTTTTYTVTGTDFYGCANTKTVMVVVSGCVGMEENIPGKTINIYPNPTSEKLMLETPGKINLIITDALGKVILEKDFEKGLHFLSLANYYEGIYFVKTMYKGETKTTKVIKSE